VPRSLFVSGQVVVLLASLVAAGCQPGVGATATGVVSFKGQPVPAGIMVQFQPQGTNASPSIAVTDAQGRYDLRFNARIRGVMPGESVVSLSIVREPNAEGKVVLPEALKGLTIPAAYGDKSTLKKTVKPGANVIDIDIVP
jgi:hypothetical protein